MGRRRRRIMGIIMMVLVTAGAVYSIWALRWAPPQVQAQPWQGVLTVWVVEGEDMAAILRNRAAVYSRRNPGVHVMVRVVEGETLALHLDARDEAMRRALPDMVAFANGAFTRHSLLQPLTLPKAVHPAAVRMVSVGVYAYAVPVMLQLPAMVAQALPESPEALWESLFKPVGRNGPRAFEGNAVALIAALYGADASGAAIPEGGKALEQAPADDGYALSRAIKGNTRLFVGSASQGRRAQEAGTPAAPLPLGSGGALWPTRVWSIGLMQEAARDPLREQAMQAFAATLLEPGAQRMAVNWGYFPVCELPPDLDDNGQPIALPQLRAQLNVQLAANVAVPSVFEQPEQSAARAQAAAGLLLGNTEAAVAWHTLWPGMDSVPQDAQQTFMADAGAARSRGVACIGLRFGVK